MGLFDWLFKKSAAPSGRTGALQVGDRVLARWFDSFFYPGRVRGVAGERYEVAFDDGDIALVHRANVRRPDVAEGSQVFCRANAGPAFLPGIVEQQNGEKLRVRYDGGGEEWTTLSLVRVSRPVTDVGEDPRPLGAPAGMPPKPMPPAGMPAAPMPGANPMAGPMPGMVPGAMGSGAILDVGEPRDDPNWRVGDRVLARWWDFYWYPGSLLGIGSNGYHVFFDDGDQRIVGDLHLMPLVIEENEALFVRPKNQPQRIYQPATVTRVKGEVIDVEFEDGNSETNTRVSRARFWRCPVGYANFSFEEGERILGQDIDGFTYPAEINSIDDDKIIVQFLDGPERMLTPELISRFELKPGTAIECRWKGGPQYFRGVINKVEGDRLFVKFDDGDQEWSNVRLVRLPPRGAS